MDLQSLAHLSFHVLPDIPFQMPFFRCRIPKDSCDVLAPLPSRGSSESRKIVLMLRDWCYAIDVLDDTGTPVPAIKIESYIWQAIHDANLLRQRGETATPIGVLTAYNRNSWAEVSFWSRLCGLLIYLWRLGEGIPAIHFSTKQTNSQHYRKINLRSVTGRLYSKHE